MTDTEKSAADYVVPNSSINEPGTYAHKVIRPGSINEPPENPAAVPELTQLIPNTAVAGSAQLTVRVIGTGFGDWTVLNINGTDRTTTFTNNKEVSAAIRPTTATPGRVYAVYAKNAMFKSNVLDFTFT